MLRSPTMVAIALLLASCTNEPCGPPNVLLVIVDTLRADELSCYGGEARTSPATCALAQRGVLFERCIAAAAYTVPSHASIMTSRYPRRHSIGYSNGRTRLRQEMTLAQIFRRGGYDTAAFVSNVNLRQRVGLTRGFAVYDADLPVSEVNRRSFFERTAPLTTERALGWLRRPREGPFFLWVHYQDPHGPYTPPLSYREMFPSRGSDEPALPVLRDQYGLGGIPVYQRLAGLVRTSQYRTRYHGETRYLDRSIGRLLAAARNADPARPLVVLLTADHGEAFGENGFYFAHGHAATPDQVHVPLILTAPGIARQRRPELVSHVDILPTLVGLAGLAAPDAIEGLALGPALRSGERLPERAVFADNGFELAAFRGDRFLVVAEANMSPAIDDFYKSGRANRDGDLMSAADITRRETYAWRADGTWDAIAADPGLDLAVARYWTGGAPAGVPVVIGPDDEARLRALGYTGGQTSPRSPAE